MNERDRAELERLKVRQLELRRQLADLAYSLEKLESRLARPEPVPQSPEIIPARPALPPPTPPVIAPVILPPPVPAMAQTAAEISTPNTAPAAQPTPAPKPPVPAMAQASAGIGPDPQAAFEPFQPVQPPAPAKKSSFEMRLGTYWLVRIGIVVLLTGRVFLGMFAYQNYIGRLGAGGRVALLYLAGGALLGTGAWLQRKEEAVRNYAQVLISGGLAMVYFTTYAAHYIPHLKIIASPLLAGVLLLGWAGFIIWLADRKKSELLALFAVLLAYYTCIITHVGLFTLYSNLVLTLAAVFFLVRNRWAAVTFASLVATYASYAFWRFYQDGQWQLVPPEEGLWTGNYFLMGYWAVFTTAVFLSRHTEFTGTRRAAFLSLNNAAFFGAYMLTMLQVHHGGFWKFYLVFGSALVALAFAARRFLAEDKLAGNAFLSQGLLLVTLGFLTYYSGLKLSLVLAVESAALVILGQQLKSRVMGTASVIAGMLATAWGINTLLVTLKSFDHDGLIMGCAVGALMMFNAFRLRREPVATNATFNVRAACFTILGLAAWLVTTWQNTSEERRGLAVACEATVFLLAARPLANPFLRFGAYAFAAFATGWEIFTLNGQFELPDLHARIGLAPGVFIGALMVLNAWWERRSSASKPGPMFQPPAVFYSLLGLAAWLVTTWVFTPREYLAPLLAIEALTLTASYYLLRLGELSLFGQAFLLVAQVLWLVDAIGDRVKRPWWNPAIIIAITLGPAHWWQRQKAMTFKQPVSLSLQGIFALAIVGVTYFWLEPLFSAPQWLAVLSALALLLTAYGTFNRYWLLAAAGQIFLVASCCQFCAQLWDGKPDWWLPLAPIAGLGMLSWSAIHWFNRHPDTRAEIRVPILQIGLAYRVIALAMSLWWVNKYIPARENCWMFAVLGIVLFALAGWRRNPELLIFSAAYTVCAMARFVMPLENAPSVYLPNLAAILTLLAQQRVAKRWPDHYPLRAEIHGGAIIAGSLGLWLYLSRWILQSSDGFYLTAGWSALGLVLFVTGMAVRERVYRWLGLAVLACALGRVVLVDVWKLETIYKILSFLALGIVLLVLGFIYNRYQEKIKEWL